MITIDIDDRELQAAIDRLAARLGDLSAVMQEIGETLAETTKQRFAAGRAPDGTPWAPNSPVTVARYFASRTAVHDRTGKRVGVRKGTYKKDGSLSASSVRMLGAKRPLHGQSGRLASQIHYRAGADQVEVGSSLIYAAVQQLGARKRQFGRAPWGDIPARPFLGLSEEDRSAVLESVDSALRDALGG